MNNVSKIKLTLLTFILTLIFIPFSSIVYSAVTEENKNKAASDLSVINYARNLLFSIVESNFRSSWVIDPENWSKVEEKTKKIQKSLESLANVKIGESSRDVRKILNSPQETRLNGKIWIYGNKSEDGTYEDLLEVFFDDKLEHVIGIISFNPRNIVENTGVKIGDPIDKMFDVYGEPVDEKDFIEDPDNKNYLGLYYLYPRSGVGFLIGQNKSTKNLLIKGVLVFGKRE